jgi:hypothetical protein
VIHLFRNVTKRLRYSVTWVHSNWLERKIIRGNPVLSQIHLECSICCRTLFKIIYIHTLLVGFASLSTFCMNRVAKLTGISECTLDACSLKLVKVVCRLFMDGAVQLPVSWWLMAPTFSVQVERGIFFSSNNVWPSVYINRNIRLYSTFEYNSHTFVSANE